MFGNEGVDIVLPADEPGNTGIFQHLVFQNRVGRSMCRGWIFGGAARPHAVGDTHGIEEIAGGLVPGGVSFGGGVNDAGESDRQELLYLPGQGMGPGEGAVLIVDDF